MSAHRVFRGLAMLALIASAVIATSGCSTFQPQQLDVLHLFGPRRPKPPAEGAPAYAVALVPVQGKPEIFKMPIGEPITVQEALEKSGALKRFGRLRIHLERTVPPSGSHPASAQCAANCENCPHSPPTAAVRSHRMEVAFDRSQQAVTPETDYAVYPGDRLIVEEDASNLIDDTFQSMSSSLGLQNR